MDPKTRKRSIISYQKNKVSSSKVSRKNIIDENCYKFCDIIVKNDQQYIRRVMMRILGSKYHIDDTRGDDLVDGDYRDTSPMQISSDFHGFGPSWWPSAQGPTTSMVRRTYCQKGMGKGHVKGKGKATGKGKETLNGKGQAGPKAEDDGASSQEQCQAPGGLKRLPQGHQRCD